MKYKTRRIFELGEIIKTITPPKKIQTSDYLELGDYPIVDQSLSDIAGWTNDSSALVHPSKDGLIVFGDHTCVLKFETNSFAQGADGIKIIEVTNDINPHFVYAYLKAFPLLNDGYKRHFSELKRLKILIPDIEIQNCVSNVRGLIDSKITSNRALSKTLEDIAQTIFKSWFIDFDPVKAKMNGEKPIGMDDETAALFPDSFEESELGLIPKGWEIKKVEEVLERSTVKGLAKSTELKNQGKTLVLQQGDSVIAGFIDAEPAVIANGDSPFFIFGDHTCRMRISTIPFSIFPNTIVLNSKIRDSYWAFGATNGLQRFETYRRHWMEFAYKLIVVPNRQITCTYGDIVKPYFEMVDLLLLQNRLLISLRDALLPRLLAGEIQIPEEMLAS